MGKSGLTGATLLQSRYNVTTQYPMDIRQMVESEESLWDLTTWGSYSGLKKAWSFSMYPNMVVSIENSDLLYQLNGPIPTITDSTATRFPENTWLPLATQKWVEAQGYGQGPESIDTTNLVTLDGTQTISGDKTFTGNVAISGYVTDADFNDKVDVNKVSEAINNAFEAAKKYADDGDADTIYDDTALSNRVKTIEDLGLVENYATKSEVQAVDNKLANYVEKEGYIVYTQEEKNKLADLNNYNDSEVRTLIGGVDERLEVIEDKVDVTNKVSEAIATALAEAKQYADNNDANTTYGLEYDSDTKKIKLIEGGLIAEIDATNFIKDGMLADVYADQTNNKLIFYWNTDAGIETTEIALSSIADIYTGVEGDRIKVTVSTDNDISADLVKGSISTDYLDANIQASLALADSAVQAVDITNFETKDNVSALSEELNGVKATAEAAYVKPENGISKGDLDASVQASLELADSALNISDYNNDKGTFALKTELEAVALAQDNVNTRLTLVEGTLEDIDSTNFVTCDGTQEIGGNKTFTGEVDFTGVVKGLAIDPANISLAGYATEQWVTNQNYVTADSLYEKANRIPFPSTAITTNEVGGLASGTDISGMSIYQILIKLLGLTDVMAPELTASDSFDKITITNPNKFPVTLQVTDNMFKLEYTDGAQPANIVSTYNPDKPNNHLMEANGTATFSVNLLEYTRPLITEAVFACCFINKEDIESDVVSISRGV